MIARPVVRPPPLPLPTRGRGSPRPACKRLGQATHRKPRPACRRGVFGLVRSEGMRGTWWRRSRRLRAGVGVDVSKQRQQPPPDPARGSLVMSSPCFDVSARDRTRRDPDDENPSMDGNPQRPRPRTPQPRPAARCLATAPLVGWSGGRIGVGLGSGDKIRNAPSCSGLTRASHDQMSPAPHLAGDSRVCAALRPRMTPSFFLLPDGEGGAERRMRALCLRRRPYGFVSSGKAIFAASPRRKRPTRAL